MHTSLMCILQLKTYMKYANVLVNVGGKGQVIFNSSVLQDNAHITMVSNTHWDSSQLGLVQ